MRPDVSIGCQPGKQLVLEEDFSPLSRYALGSKSNQ